MTITPRRGPATRTARTRTRRTAQPTPGRHAPAVRMRPRHAAEPVALPELMPPAPVPPGARRRHSYLTGAVLRCALYLAPLSVAVAGAGPLAQVAWPVPVITLLLGWTAAQALTSLGVAVGRRTGPNAACRLVGAGFAAVTGLWCALVWVAPDALLGPHRGLALVVGLGGLATLATVTAALVTRAEAAVVRWSVPCWLLAAATLAALAGSPVGGVPIGTLLPAAIVVALVRAFRPAMLPGGHRRRGGPARSELRRAGGYLVIGASQAICVGAALAGRAVRGDRAVLAAAAARGADPRGADRLAHRPGRGRAGGQRGVTVRHAGRRCCRRSRWAARWPSAAYRLPTAFAEPAGARAGVLALAGGTLLGGVIAITFLLAARGRTVVAAALAAAPPLATAALKLLPLPAAGSLPNAVGVLAVTHLAGLLVVALTAADHRRPS